MPFLVLKTDFEAEQGKILVSIQTWDIKHQKKGYDFIIITYSNTPIVFIIHFKTLSHEKEGKWTRKSACKCYLTSYLWFDEKNI